MRGRIIKRKGSNNYTIVLQLGLDPATGKRKQQWITAGPSKREAEKQMASFIHDLDNGTFVAPNKTTLAEYLKEWIKSIQGSLSPRTIEGYVTIINRIVPALGATPLTQLKPELLQKYYSDCLRTGRLNRQGGLNPFTVRHHHALLHRALENAVEWDLIIRNPADAAHPPQPRPAEINVMSESEIQTFLDAARQTPYFHLFHTILFTGLRRSEVLALRWSDIDLMLCQLSVSRSIHQLRDRSFVFRQPKSAKGRRTVALSPTATKVLKEHKEIITAERILRGVPLKDSDLVFSKPDGSPIPPNRITRAWPALAKRCGILASRLHDARHTHASLMLKAGIHPRIVQERLGHSTIAITLDIYSHVSPGLQEAAARRFDEALQLRHNENVYQPGQRTELVANS
jgi:integrase